MLPERLRPIMQLLSLFHDYALAVIRMILMFVAGASLSLIRNTLLSDSLIITIIELV